MSVPLISNKDFLSNPDSTLPTVLPTYVYLFNGIETVQLVFALFWAPLSAVVFLKRSMCHRNLVIIIMSTFLLYIILLIARLSICVMGIIDYRVLAEKSLYIVWSPMCYFEMARIFAGYTAALQVSLIVIERCIATVNMHSYEKNSHAALVIFVISCTYLSGIYASFLIFGSNETLIRSCIGMVVIIVFVAVTFQVTKVVSQRQLSKSKRINNGYTLSQRFQLQENLRMIQILKRIMVSFVGCVSLMIVAFLLGVFLMADPFGDEVYLLRGGINMLVSINANLIVVVAITSTYVWRQMLKTHLKAIFFCCSFERINQIKKRMSVSAVSYLKNSDGKQMMFNIHEEKDIYFNQYRNAWA